MEILQYANNYWIEMSIKGKEVPPHLHYKHMRYTLLIDFLNKYFTEITALEILEGKLYFNVQTIKAEGFKFLDTMNAEARAFNGDLGPYIGINFSINKEE